MHPKGDACVINRGPVMKPIIYSAIFATSSFALAPFAASDTYRSEINATYTDIDSDLGFDSYSLNLQGRYYFSPVDTTGLPLAEAAFLQKSSSVMIALGKDEYEYEGDGYTSEEYTRSVNANYYIPDSIFFVGGGVSKRKVNFEYSGDENYAGYEYSGKWKSRLNARIGIAPIDGLQIWSDFNESSDLSEYWNLNAKYVKPLDNQTAFAIETHYADDRIFDMRSLLVNVDYYLTHRSSIGLGAAHFMFDSNDRDDDSKYHARARHFFTEKTSIDLTYYSSDYSDSWMIGGTVRF
jgi:hypothetical protein